jgi:1-acyl-sn-glycerol-3-phosphate acyltransferase
LITMKESLIHSVTRRVARTVFFSLYRVEIQREASLLLNGPAVILPKHQYWTDIPLVGLSFDFPLCYVAKKELFRYPGVRGFLRLLGGIPFDRERPIKTLTSVKDLLSRLKASEKIVVFPEGTYFRGVIGPGKSRLIQTILSFQPELKERIPFVPMGIRYGQRTGWRRRVDIQIGHPLFAEKESEAVLLTRQVMAEIARLSGLPMEKSQSAKRRAQSA